MKRQEEHIVQGMTNDISVNQFSNKYVFDAHNIRITAVNGNSSLLSVSNEKGTTNIPIPSINGYIIGYAIFNTHIVVFATTNTGNSGDSAVDTIADLTINDTACTTTIFFSGLLGFSKNHPIEAIPVYENESNQKVYWTDGINQPRMIKLYEHSYTANDFEFARAIELNHKIEVTKNNTGGEFPSGTIQYAFAYYNKFKQETRLFECTPLYYLSPKERGLAADQKSGSSFNIKLTDLDSSFDFVRVYSIIRTQNNATPSCRIVGDYSIIKTGHPVSFTSSGSFTSKTEFSGNTADLEIINGYNGLHIEWVSDITSNHIDNYTVKILNMEPGVFLYNIKTGQVFLTSDDVFLYIYDGNSTSYFLADKDGGTIQYGTIVTSYDYEAELVDNGIIGETVDASSLLYIGGEEIVASTIEQKDNTLFLGNIKQTRPNIGNIIINNKTLHERVHSFAVSNLTQAKYDYYKNDGISNAYVDFNPSGINFYDYHPDNNRSSQQKKVFKFGENYRLGLMAQYKTGEWSEVLWIDDADQKGKPEIATSEFRTYGWKYVVDSIMANALLEAGYKRIAPVVVYPSLPDRRVICQGILCPTIYNVKDRRQGTPFVQSDWRFRFEAHYCESIQDDIQLMQDDIMFFPYAKTKSGDVESWMDNTDFTNYFAEDYMSDTNILTFHSPDIENSEELYQNNFDDCKLRITGITYTTIPYDMEMIDDSLTAMQWDCENELGANTEHSHFIKNNLNNKMLPCFMDSWIKPGSDTNEVPHSDSVFGWEVYPWHRNGSLNNQGKQTTNMTKGGYSRTALLKHKRIASLYYGKTSYLAIDNSIGTNLNIDNQNLQITTPQLFNSDSISVIKIDGGSLRTGKALSYYGNVDKLLVPNLVNMSNINLGILYPQDSAGTQVISVSYSTGKNKSIGYPILYGWKKYIGSTVPTEAQAGSCNYYVADNNLIASSNKMTEVTNKPYYWGDGEWKLDTGSGDFYGKDPVPIKYKTTPHLVFALKASNTNNIKCMKFGIRSEEDWMYPKSFTHSPFWLEDNAVTCDIEYPDVSMNSTHIPFDNNNGFVRGLPVGDLYRTFTTEEMNSRFGGRTQSAFENDSWTICGPIVKLIKDNSATIEFKEGDTYLERYDCVKCLPYNDDDVNSVINIYSTEIESRVNLDERYDRNRGMQNNLAINNNNFNLFNHLGYEQTPDFFNYHGIDYDKFSNLSFPNMVTWTKQKTAGEEVDTWTDVDLISTIDLDGEKGKVTALKQWNDGLYAFQENGIAQLLFNSRVQIPTSDDVPIEITNGMKMEGKRYLSDTIGVKNKFSICNTSLGIYFIDSISNSLYKYNGQFENLSLKEGMKSWMDSQAGTDINTFYDKVNMDLYMISKDWCLVYSEQFGKFISYMDYNNVDLMFNISNGSYMLNTMSNSVKLWKMFSGDYNSFFGTYKPYWLTFIANGDPLYDKTFDNIDLRADMYDDKNNLIPNLSFDYMKTWNNNQNSGDVTLSTSGLIPNLKKKFNVWRINIPRDCTNKLNRMRNTSIYIKLGVTKSDALANKRMQFMDLKVSYFI